MLKSFFIPLFILLILDNPIGGIIAYIKIPFLVKIMGWVSYFGLGWIQAVFSGSLMLIGLIVKKDSKMAEAGKKGLLSVAFAGILVQSVKLLIGRPRPKILAAAGFSLGPSIASGFDSFPSGHATSAFALASVMASYYPNPWTRYLLYIYAGLVSFSRIYINAHFPSDVFAGILLGLWIGRAVLTKSTGDIKTFIKGRGAVIAIAALSFFLFFYHLGSPGLFDVDEAVYAESAREMVESGDWITPHYNYTDRFDKPAMIYWIISSAYKLFGVNEFAARFWSAVSGLALVLFSYYFVRRIGNHLWGVLSGLILATSLEVIVLSHASITDMPLTLFITASLFCFYLGYASFIPPSLNPPLEKGGWGDLNRRLSRENNTYKKWWYRGFFLFAGLAVLTKGPVGIVIPGLIVGVFLLLKGQVKDVLKDMGLISGMIIFLLFSLPWYVLEIWVSGWGFITEFLIKHNLTRFTGVVSGHQGAIYYFIPIVLFGFFPWSAFIIPGLIKSFRKIRQQEGLFQNYSVMLFSSIWFLTVFIFFSVSKTKLPGYILPLAPALAILAGRVWYEYIESERKVGFACIFCIVLGIAIAAGLIYIPSFLNSSPSISKYIFEPIEGQAVFYVTGGFIISGMILFILSMKIFPKGVSFGILVMMMSITTLLLLNGVVPIADKYLQAPLKEFSRMAGAMSAKDGGGIIAYNLNNPSVVFYARHPVVELRPKHQKELLETLSSPKKIYVIAKDTNIEWLLNNPDVHVIEQKGMYVLLTNQK